jgi:hypothetical protein
VRERAEESEAQFGLPQRRDVGTDKIAERVGGRLPQQGVVGRGAGAEPSGEEGLQFR